MRADMASKDVLRTSQISYLRQYPRPAGMSRCSELLLRPIRARPVLKGKRAILVQLQAGKPDDAAATSAGLTERAAEQIEREATRIAQMAEPKKQAADRQFIKMARVGGPTSPPAADKARAAARWALYAIGAVLLFSLLRSVYRVFSKYTSATAVRSRTVNKNKLVVDVLNQYLPANRISLTPGEMSRLRLRTGFTATEIFRKYLWYLLRERAFDEAAVEDMLALRSALSLTNVEVADALRERAQRIYDKYGNVMLDVDGMSKAGIDRKATCRSLFSKILYLAEYEQLLPQESDAAKGLDIPSIFGATDDDTAKLRIISLVQVDIDNLESQFGSSSMPET
eukprot:jgi/Botrbrau1/2664/Bobra.0203s0013.2